MYSGLGVREGRESREQERRERLEERVEFAERAQAEYPELRRREAVTALQERETAGRETTFFVREYAPILVAVAGGLIVLTFLRKRRR